MSFSEAQLFGVARDLGTLADDAAGLIRKGLGERGSTKPDGSYVTPTDMVVNELVIDRLTALYPGVGVLGEEASSNPDALTRFVVDPIDGTLLYTMGIGGAGFLVSYEVDGVPVVALIDDPIARVRVLAILGQGCFFNGVEAQLDATPRTNVVVCEALRGTQWAHESVCAEVVQRGYSPYSPRSFGVPSTLVARSGASGALFGRSSRWDVSAAWLIGKESGCVVSDFSGKELFDGVAISSEHGTVISHPTAHDDVLAALRAVVRG